MRQTKHVFIFFIALATLLSSVTLANTTQQAKMQALAFMVGDWVGTSRSFRDDETSSVPAYQQIQYKIDKSILTIDLLSESLLIHTIIYYDAKDETYYYCPYYKGGAGKYRGQLIDGNFWVYFNENRRIVFKRLADGRFQEYGEKRIDGHWQKYFEDTFKSL